MAEKRKQDGGSPNNQTAAYILIGLGVIFLLVNVLDIQWWRLWPLVLVAVGLYLLFGRNSIGSTSKTGHFSAPLDSAESADVELHLSVGEAQVTALAASDRLIEAELTYVGDIDFEVTGDREKSVLLRQSVDSALQWVNPANWFSGETYQWQVGLSRKVPLRLHIHGGMGKAALDLRPLLLDELRLQGGMGEMKLYLPPDDEGYPVRLQGGMGELEVDLPAATPLTLDVHGGVGEITIQTPPGAAIRLRSRGGIGDVNVPGTLRRVEASESDFELNKSGTWETDNYHTATHPIDISYQGGVGTLKIR